MDIRKKKRIVCLVQSASNQEDNDDDELSIREQLTNISEALEMLRKLHIFA